MFAGLSAIDLLVLFGSLLISMAAHEAMHAFTAHWLGDTTAQEAGRLTLNPLRHIDVVTTLLLPIVLIALHAPPIFAAKPVPFDPSRVRFGEYGAALVSLAGPCTNFVLACLAAILVHTAHPGSFAASALVLFLDVNVALFVFNMIPFPPLDGSRLLYAFAPEPLQQFMARIEALGFPAILVFLVLFFPFVSPLVARMESSILNFLLL